MSFDPVSYAMGRAAAPGGTDVSDTTATAADVLSAKAFYLANGTKTQGSIASKAAQTYTPTTADQTIAAGQYLTGAQTVKGDANLVAGNIKKDVTIFGVTGTYEGGGGGGGISLSSITITTPPTKTIYYEGDTFEATGMVITASYSNGMARTVTGYTVSPTVLALSTTYVTVSYTEAGTTVTANQRVAVYEDAPFTFDWHTLSSGFYLDSNSYDGKPFFYLQSTSNPWTPPSWAQLPPENVIVQVTMHNVTNTTRCRFGISDNPIDGNVYADREAAYNAGQCAFCSGDGRLVYDASIVTGFVTEGTTYWIQTIQPSKYLWVYFGDKAVDSSDVEIHLASV